MAEAAMAGLAALKPLGVLLLGSIVRITPAGWQNLFDLLTDTAYYTRPIALRLAACQKNVVGLLFFHVTDEADLDRWQSGVYYADDTPKSSLPAVRAARLDPATAIRNG